MTNRSKWILLGGFLVVIFGGGCFSRYSIGVGEIPLHNYYGRVVDQEGNPVPDATVIDTLAMLAPGVHAEGMLSMHNDRSEISTIKYKLETKPDSNGFFQFTDTRGVSSDVQVSKDGYDINADTAKKEPLNGIKTSPVARAVFILWKHA